MKETIFVRGKGGRSLIFTTIGKEYLLLEDKWDIKKVRKTMISLAREYEKIIHKPVKINKENKTTRK